jgi:CRISPR-associated exonuclease Cas4
VLPELSWADNAAWARAIDFQLGGVPELDLRHFAKKPLAQPEEATNRQSRDIFASEQANIERAFRRIHWIRPSEGDPDNILLAIPPASAWEEIETTPQTEGSSLRGVMLHKLMEELLTDEVAPSLEALRARCKILIPQLRPVGQRAPHLDAEELAATAWRTYSLPELADNRDELVPEVPVYARLGGLRERLVSGRADYRQQLLQYVQALSAARGAVVYMTSGQIDWVDAAAGARAALLGPGVDL